MKSYAPAGQTYLPYQLTGIGFAAERDAALIADEMGLGKTIQAIGLLNTRLDLERVLVVCPAGLRINWRRELDAWLVNPLVEVQIVSWDGLHKLNSGYAWDCIIADEAHYAKNREARRSRALMSLRSRVRVALTGTPILNRPIELWAILHWLRPDLWPEKSFWPFVRRYCGAKLTWVPQRGSSRRRRAWDTSGASHLDELAGHLRHLMIRRLKADVLLELPAKRRQIVELDTRMDRELRDKMIAMEARLDYEAQARGLEDAVSVAWQDMAGLRHDMARAKLPAAVDFLADAATGSGKLVVMAHHRDVLESLQRELGDFRPVLIYGGMTDRARQAAVDAFQQRGEVRVFLGQIQAAGVGITLTAASHVAFVELEWTPGLMSQAEDRCHRIGQHDAVLVQHLVLPGSLDARLAKTLVAKQRVIDKTLNQ